MLKVLTVLFIILTIYLAVVLGCVAIKIFIGAKEVFDQAKLEKELRRKLHE